MSVYLRATAIENLATDPHAIDLLESAISQLENSGEKSTLLLRVLPEEFDEDFPHDFRIIAGKYGPRFVTPGYEELDVAGLLVNAQGEPLKDVTDKPVAPDSYASELTTRLGLVTGVNRGPASDLSFWKAQLAGLRGVNPRRVAPQRRSASTPPGGGHLSQHGPLRGI